MKLFLSVNLFFIICCFVLIFWSNSASFVFAQDTVSEDVSATVRISVCGDGVAEYPEDCDGDDLGEATCRGLGFFTGVLECTYSCEFDTAGCFGVAPTQTPSSTTSPQIYNSSKGNGESAVTAIGEGSTGARQSLIVRVAEPLVRKLREIHKNLFIFDIDGDGLISRAEISVVIGKWVDISGDDGKECDFNDDGKCNLVDFSILLYHVDRELNG